jgi:hypothetical protein
MQNEQTYAISFDQAANFSMSPAYDPSTGRFSISFDNVDAHQLHCTLHYDIYDVELTPADETMQEVILDLPAGSYKARVHCTGDLVDVEDTVTLFQ